jgi:hypothetical protein
VITSWHTPAHAFAKLLDFPFAMLENSNKMTPIAAALT